MLRPLLFIEGLELVRQNLDIRIGGFVFDRQPISGPQPQGRTVAHPTSISQQLPRPRMIADQIEIPLFDGEKQQNTSVQALRRPNRTCK
jgi:hypothetical protein